MNVHKYNIWWWIDVVIGILYIFLWQPELPDEVFVLGLIPDPYVIVLGFCAVFCTQTSQFEISWSFILWRRCQRVTTVAVDIPSDPFFCREDPNKIMPVVVNYSLVSLPAVSSVPNFYCAVGIFRGCVAEEVENRTIYRSWPLVVLIEHVDPERDSDAIWTQRHISKAVVLVISQDDLVTADCACV